jgi:Tol biopolymer transport system component
VTGDEPGQQPRTYVRELDGGKSSAITAAGVRASHVSPDSQTVVVIKSGTLYLHSLDSGNERVIGSVGRQDIVMRWSSDGRYLFLQRNEPENRNAKIMRMDVQTGQSEVWREMKPPEQTGVVTGLARISGDGKSYAFSYQRDLATLYLVRGLK